MMRAKAQLGENGVRDLRSNGDDNSFAGVEDRLIRWRDLNLGQAASYSAFIRESLAGDLMRLSDRRSPGAMVGLPIAYNSLVEQ